MTAAWDMSMATGPTNCLPRDHTTCLLHFHACPQRERCHRRQDISVSGRLNKPATRSMPSVGPSDGWGKSEFKTQKACILMPQM
jgi:hypothetical protein